MRDPDQEDDAAGWAGVVIGAAAAVAALFLWRVFVMIPFGLLLLDAGLAWGITSSLRRAPVGDGRSGSRWVASLAPYVGAGLLFRRLIDPAALGYGLTHTLVLPAVLVAVGLVMLSSPLTKRFAGAMGAVLLLSALFPVVVAAVPSARLLFASGTAVVIVALIVQLNLSKRTRLAILASPAALAVAAAQLLDGVITYLAVNDPLGLAPRTFYEQMPLSAWLLANIGPGYGLVKWALAIGIVLALEKAHPWRKDPGLGVAMYLLVLLLSLGPALFSTFNLLT